MPILFMRGQHFAISQFILRPFFTSIANSNLYPLLWNFSSYLLSNISFTNSILILFGIKNYILGKTTILYLTRLIYSISPIIGNIFESILKKELTFVRIYSTVKQKSIRRLISIIIINSFLLIFKSIFKFFSKIIFIIIITTLSIFWLGAVNNIKYLLNIAFEIKDLIYYYTHIDLPIPDKFKINKSILDYLKSLFNIFKDNKIEDKIPYVRKISKFEGIELNFSYKNKNNINNNNIEDNNIFDFNDIYLNNQNIIADMLINSSDTNIYLIHLFNEFNLFC